MNSIRFSHIYTKMPTKEQLDKGTIIVSIFIVTKDALPDAFLEFDTAYGQEDIFGMQKHYPLPDGKLILILLLTDGVLWCTMRSFTEQKAEYYRTMIGKQVLIITPEK